MENPTLTRNGLGGNHAVVAQCLSRIELRAKSKRKLGVKLTSVEAHILRCSRPLKRRIFGPPILSVAGQIVRVFVRPVPIVLVLCLIIAAEVNSDASRSFAPEELPPPVAQSLTTEAAAVLDEKVVSAQQELAAEEEQASRAAADELLKRAALTVAAAPPAPPAASEAAARLIPMQPAAQQMRAGDPNSGLIEFISGVIAVYYPEITDPGMIARQIVEVSVYEGIDALYVSSIIATESRFKTNARSHKGALGLMQLKPSTAREVFLKRKKQGQSGLLKLSDPEVNIRLGVHYIKELERHYHGNRSLALAAYNWGPANVDESLQARSQIPGSVRQYAYSILEKALRWNKHFQTASKHAKTFSESLNAEG